MAKVLTVLSLGAGVQSTTLALAAARGLVGPMPDCAIFADTGDEPAAVYKHLAWLMEPGRLPFPVHVARAWEGYGYPGIDRPLGDLILAAARGENAKGLHSRPPLYTVDEKGKKGFIARQCTDDYKITVIERKVRELLGLKRRAHWPKDVRVSQWIGISTDEATRRKPFTVRRKVKGQKKAVHFPHPTIAARWPLLDDLRWSRASCLHWMRRNGYPEPPKSACTFCPFHSNAEWRNVRDNDPAGWSKAIQIDVAIRHGFKSKGLTAQMFLHRDCLPLAEVDLSDEPNQQINLFQNDCTGTCAV